MTALLDVALSYAQRGWAVFPCTGKRPRTEHGVKDATTDADQIRTWWTTWPNANIGLATGQVSGLYVVDIDDLDALSSLTLAPTLVASTPRGGLHYYYERPDGDGWGNTAGKLATKVDTRGDGGYVIAPGSSIDGTRYEWRQERDPAPLPDELRIRLRPVERRTGDRRMPALPINPTSWANRALLNEVDALAHAEPGGRNDALNRCCFALGQIVAGGHLSEAIVVDAVARTALAIGLSQAEIKATIASGMRAGAEHPRHPPERQRTTPVTSAAAATDEDDNDAPEVVASKKRPERLGSAIEFLSVLARDALAWGEMEQAELVMEPPPWRSEGPYPRRVTDVDYVRAQVWMEELGGRTIGRQNVVDAFADVCARRPINHVRDYLAGLTWDGVGRVDTWLTRYFGCEDDETTRKMGRWWLISAVARARSPGCQVDHVLVLEGGQGLSKSSMLRTLSCGWFLDSSLDPGSKDASAQIAGAWVVELAELDSLRRADITRVKAWITQREETYRPAYARKVVREPRRCVFAATTNESQYLQDDTGNRRFWPVTVGTLDREALERDRDQLWAEAVALYEASERWWPSTPEEVAGLTAKQEERLARDPWEAELSLWADGRSECTTKDAMTHLGLAVERRTRTDEMRCARVLRQLGFTERIRHRVEGNRTWLFRRCGQQVSRPDAEKVASGPTGPISPPKFHLPFTQKDVSSSLGRDSRNTDLNRGDRRRQTVALPATSPVPNLDEVGPAFEIPEVAPEHADAYDDIVSGLWGEKP